VATPSATRHPDSSWTDQMNGTIDNHTEARPKQFGRAVSWLEHYLAGREFEPRVAASM
jgi:hypothetical protein